MVTIEHYDRDKHGDVDDADYVISVPNRGHPDYRAADLKLALEIASRIGLDFYEYLLDDHRTGSVGGIVQLVTVHA